MEKRACRAGGVTGQVAGVGPGDAGIPRSKVRISGL